MVGAQRVGEARPHGPGCVMRTAALLAALAIGALSPGAARGPHAAQGEEIAVDRNAIGSFALVDHAGKSVTERDFRGRFMLVFFGYTFCPDVCPTDLQTIGAALDALGDAGKRVQPIFITLDPERDTAKVLARYVRHFHPRLIGLTGTPEQIALAAQTYGVIHVKVMQSKSRGGAEDTGYVVDHSAIIYLLGPDGRFLAAYAHGTGPKQLAAGLSKHLRADRS